MNGSMQHEFLFSLKDLGSHRPKFSVEVYGVSQKGMMKVPSSCEHFIIYCILCLDENCLLAPGILDLEGK